MPEENKAPENNGGNVENKGGDQQPQVEKIEAVRNPDGTITIGDKSFIDKQSYDVIAEKQRKYTKEREKQEAEKIEAEKKALAEKGEWEKLAKMKEQEANETKLKFQNQLKVNALISAVGKDAIDIDTILKVADLNSVTISEDGIVDKNSVDSVVSELRQNKSFLFGSADVKKPVGSSMGGAPDGSVNRVFTESEIQNMSIEEYNKNRDAILLAQSRGEIRQN